jgi:hypothetical protein
VHGAFACGQVAQRATGVLEVRLSGVGGPHGAPSPVQQLDAQGSFELFDLLGERGLGDVQFLGGAGEVALVSDGKQVAQVAQLYDHASKL